MTGADIPTGETALLDIMIMMIGIDFLDRQTTSLICFTKNYIRNYKMYQLYIVNISPSALRNRLIVEYKLNTIHQCIGLLYLYNITVRLYKINV